MQVKDKMCRISPFNMHDNPTFHLAQQHLNRYFCDFMNFPNIRRIEQYDRQLNFQRLFFTTSSQKEAIQNKSYNDSGSNYDCITNNRQNSNDLIDVFNTNASNLKSTSIENSHFLGSVNSPHVPFKKKTSFTIENILGKSSNSCTENHHEDDVNKHNKQQHLRHIQSSSSLQETYKNSCHVPVKTTSLAPTTTISSHANVKDTHKTTTSLETLKSARETSAISNSFQSSTTTKMASPVHTTNSPITKIIPAPRTFVKSTANNKVNMVNDETDVTSSTKDSPLLALYSMTNQTLPGQIVLGRCTTHHSSQLRLTRHIKVERKCQKSRTAFTNYQLEELEKRFAIKKYVNTNDRDYIAAQLGLSSSQVITWFQNRRAKMKRDIEEWKADIAASQRSLSLPTSTSSSK